MSEQVRRSLQNRNFRRGWYHSFLRIAIFFQIVNVALVFFVAKIYFSQPASRYYTTNGEAGLAILCDMDSMKMTRSEKERCAKMPSLG